MQEYKGSTSAKIAQVQFESGELGYPSTISKMEIVQKERQWDKNSTIAFFATVKETTKECNVQKMHITNSNKRIAKLFGTTEKSSAVQPLP